MDQFLYGLPLIGLVFQLIGYLVAVLPIIAPTIYQYAVPIGLAAMCGVMCERSGVVNIGLEGTMLVAAFVGWAAGVYLVPVFGEGEPSALFGLTPALIGAFGLAILAGVLVSLVHAWLSISVRADQIIAGTIINIAAFGITSYLNQLIARSSPAGAGAFDRLELPDWLIAIPVVGPVFDTFLAQGPIGMSLLVIVVVFQVFLFRSRWGLRTRAVGEHPRAAETVGIDVIRLRYRNVIAGGALAAMGGAYLSMESGGGSFQETIVSGRGFIGLAAVIIGRWTPLGAFGAALLFASAWSIGTSFKLAPPPGDIAALGQLPGQFWDALPYIVTIVVLAGFVGKSIPPAADGQPYEREAAT